MVVEVRLLCWLYGKLVAPVGEREDRMSQIHNTIMGRLSGAGNSRPTWISNLLRAGLLTGIMSFSALGDGGARAAASAPTAGTLPVRIVVPAGAAIQFVFDHDRDACDRSDIPDAPARAFRDSSGQVHLIAGYHVNRQLIGPALDQVTPSCPVIYQGDHNDNPANYNDRSWVSAVYTLDGTTVHGLLSNEFHGHARPDLCPSRSYSDCWYNTVTAVVSTDLGFHFALTPSRHLVAGLPYRYQGDLGRRSGVFSPSNIFRRGEYFYAFVWVEQIGAQRRGACLLRTTDLSDSRAWRAWDGEGFQAQFIDPYREAGSPQQYVCAPVASDRLSASVRSVVWHAPSALFIGLMAMKSSPQDGGPSISGIWAATSPDLITWSKPKLVWAAPLLTDQTCSAEAAYYYPSLLDETSKTRNFEDVGDRAHLYLTRLNLDKCRVTWDRDLVRLPVQITVDDLD